MKNYDVRFCKCGHIHFIEQKEIDEAIEANEDLYLGCGSCGTISRIGADEFFDDCSGKKIYNMYNYDIQSEDNVVVTSDTFTAKEGKKIHKIIWSKGKAVPMMSNMNATVFDLYTCKFEDTWYPDFVYHIDEMTLEQLKEQFEKWKTDRKTINSIAFARSLTEDEARALCSYSFPQLIGLKEAIKEMRGK